jgi:hypothetical protein
MCPSVTEVKGTVTVNGSYKQPWNSGPSEDGVFICMDWDRKEGNGQKQQN